MPSTAMLDHFWFLKRAQLVHSERLCCQHMLGLNWMTLLVAGEVWSTFPCFNNMNQYELSLKVQLRSCLVLSRIVILAKLYNIYSFVQQMCVLVSPFACLQGGGTSSCWYVTYRKITHIYYRKIAAEKRSMPHSTLCVQPSLSKVMLFCNYRDNTIHVIWCSTIELNNDNSLDEFHVWENLTKCNIWNQFGEKRL